MDDFVCKRCGGTEYFLTPIMRLPSCAGCGLDILKARERYKTKKNMAKYLKRAYDITAVDYDNLPNVCLVCGQGSDSEKLLCHTCAVMVDTIEYDPVLLEMAIEYIRSR